MDYYATLGLQRNASDAEIKKAYRSMAMKYHPDRGGDEKKFKEISQAYEYLSDPQKKQIIDLGGDPNGQQGMGGGQSPFEFHFNTGNMNDIFGNFGFGGFGRQPQRRNRSLNVNVEITLEDVLKGKDFTAEVSIPGKNKMINIQIPPGIEHGQQIRYEGMGDDSIPSLKPGDLLVNVIVREHHRYKREGTSLIIDQEVTVWDALLGASIEIQTLDRKTLSMNLLPGTQPDTVMSCKGEGLPNMRTRQRGNLLIRIKITVPKNLNPEQINMIKQIKQGNI
jgi:DnaJ-class molecular chaperone